jgi:hypothetical protein
MSTSPDDVVQTLSWWLAGRAELAQVERALADVAEQLTLELRGLEGRCVDAAGEAAQHEPRRELVRACRA